MERQAGLGRSLEDVLDALTPVETDPAAPGRVLFEPRDLERQVDQLAVEIEDLRGRVQHLVGLVPDDALVDGTANGTHHDPAGAPAGSEPASAGPRVKQHGKQADKKKKKKKKKHKKHKKSGDG